MKSKRTKRPDDVADIPAGEIVLDYRDNARRDYATKALDPTTGKEQMLLHDRGFVADVRLRWVLQPPRVRWDGKAYRAVYGFRRILAAQEVDATRLLTCSVEPANSEADALVANFIENEQRMDLRPWEKAEAIYQLRKRTKLSLVDISKRLAMSSSHVTNLHNLRAKAHPELWELYRKHGAGLDWHKVADIVKLPRGEQVAAWRDMVEGKRSKPKKAKSNARTESNPTADELLKLARALYGNSNTRIQEAVHAGLEVGVCIGAGDTTVAEQLAKVKA